MPLISYREAILRALDEELARDERVIFFGEDVARAGGVFKVTPGLVEKYGGLRVRDTPISESAIVGAGIGAAVTGLRPVIELMFADFALVAMDQIVNQAAKMRYMSGGQLSVPLTIRAPQGAGAGFGSQHSQSAESWFMNFPGLKVVVPATPADALGLLKTAIRDDNPVIFLEHKSQYVEKGEVPDGEHLVPFGSARIARRGTDVTIVAVQRMLAVAQKAAETLAARGVSCEIIDPRTVVPLDMAKILDSVRRTGRLMTIEEGVQNVGWGAEIVSQVSDQAIWSLEAPVVRVTMGNTIIPFSHKLEERVIPDAQRVIGAVEQMLK
jgi:acetoin:2,6-dichlorophenolindophenol oxidoreductase subunit beta